MLEELGLFDLAINASLSVVVLTTSVRRLFLLLPAGGQIHLVVGVFEGWTGEYSHKHVGVSFLQLCEHFLPMLGQ